MHGILIESLFGVGEFPKLRLLYCSHENVGMLAETFGEPGGASLRRANADEVREGHHCTEQASCLSTALFAEIGEPGAAPDLRSITTSNNSHCLRVISRAR